MNRVLKIFCTGPEQDVISGNHRLIERYDGFVLVEVSAGESEALARRYPVEDITDQYQIEIAGRSIDTSKPRVDMKGRNRSHPAYTGARRLAPGPHHYLVQFVGPIKETWLHEVKRSGGEPREPAGGFAYVVRADSAALQSISALPAVRWIGHLRHEDRVSPSLAGQQLAALPRTRVLPGAYTVEFFSAGEMKLALSAVAALDFKVLSQDRKAAIAVIQDVGGERSARGRIRKLSAVHGVRGIRERTLKRTSNDVAAGIMGTAAALSATGLDLSGNGETVGVCDTGLDTGDVDTLHEDFSGRVERILSYPISPDFSALISNPRADDGGADLDSGHGTHVAGSVLGDGGAASAAGVTRPIRGLAYRARLVFQAVEQEMHWTNPGHLKRLGRYLLSGIPTNVATLFGDAYALGVRVHSNSWGGGDPGTYDEQCQQLDGFIWEHKDFCALFANGNDGNDRDGNGSINPMSVSSPATAKNCISVGASENLRPAFNGERYGGWWRDDYPVAPLHDDPMADNPEQVVAFSSRGPTRDGRTKPDVVAPGTFILSTRSTVIAANNMAWGAFPPSRKYCHMGGTSMATPLAAGAVALIREYLRTRRSIPSPTAALLKAALIAGAVRLPGGPGGVADNDQGYGRVNLDRILAPPAPGQARFIDQTRGLRSGEVHTEVISLASSRMPLRVVLAYSDFPGPKLVNNLNLILVAPDGTRHVGNASAGRGLNLDVTNNVEVMDLADPAPGEWSLQVVASNVPQGPQDFALVVTGHLGRAESDQTLTLESKPERVIPDNVPRGIDDVIEVNRAGSVAAVSLQVDIEHPFLGDLRVWLSAPDNQRVMLHDRSGGGAKNLRRRYDVGTTPALAKFVGIGAPGEWRLTVADQAALDQGELVQWSLSLHYADSDPMRAEATPGLPIPDDDAEGIEAVLELTGTGRVGAVSVWVDITHAWIADLHVSLKSPNGREVVLHDRAGGSRDKLIETYDSERIAGLASLAGETLGGRWTLRVADLGDQDIGKLNRWGLHVTR